MVKIVKKKKTRRKRRYLLPLTTFLDGIGLFEENVHWFSNRHRRFLRAGSSYILDVKVMKTGKVYFKVS